MEQATKILSQIIGRTKIVAVAAAALMSFTSAAQAITTTVVIDFDDITAPDLFGDQTTQLTDEFADLGILFSPDGVIEDANEVLNDSSFTTPSESTSPNLLASSFGNLISAVFTVPVFEVGALIGISGGSDMLTIFDDLGGVLGNIVGDDTFVSLTSATPIASFTVAGTASDTAAIDNLTFEVGAIDVPAPGALALLGLGIAAVGVGRRSHKPLDLAAA
ncbi:MAG: PEP-CTERM sorting domain-containing protein [Pseudomonadota bacterium]